MGPVEIGLRPSEEDSICPISATIGGEIELRRIRDALAKNVELGTPPPHFPSKLAKKTNRRIYEKSRVAAPTSHWGICFWH